MGESDRGGFYWVTLFDRRMKKNKKKNENGREKKGKINAALCF